MNSGAGTAPFVAMKNSGNIMSQPRLQTPVKVPRGAWSGVRQFYPPGGPRQEIQAHPLPQIGLPECRLWTTFLAWLIAEPNADDGVCVIVSQAVNGIVSQVPIHSPRARVLIGSSCAFALRGVPVGGMSGDPTAGFSMLVPGRDRISNLRLGGALHVPQPDDFRLLFSFQQIHDST